MSGEVPVRAHVRRKPGAKPSIQFTPSSEFLRAVAYEKPRDEKPVFGPERPIQPGLAKITEQAQRNFERQERQRIDAADVAKAEAQDVRSSEEAVQAAKSSVKETAIEKQRLQAESEGYLAQSKQLYREAALQKKSDKAEAARLASEAKRSKIEAKSLQQQLSSAKVQERHAKQDLASAQASARRQKAEAKSAEISLKDQAEQSRLARAQLKRQELIEREEMRKARKQIAEERKAERTKDRLARVSLREKQKADRLRLRAQKRAERLRARKARRDAAKAKASRRFLRRWGGGGYY